METSWFARGRRVLLRILLPVALVTVPAVSQAQAQQGAIAGRVTDETGTQPLEGASVFLQGGDVGAVTDAQGRYRIEGVAVGQWEVRVRFIGFEEASQFVTVAAGQTTTANFGLAIAAVGVDELVVTATGNQRKRELGNSIGTIDGDLVEEAAIPTFSDLLNARVSNVQILNSGGTTGAGSRVRVRGAASVSLNNEPLIYVDGARVSNESGDFFGDATNLAGGQAPSRLDDINPEDIESIEIVKGPSAATLYGTQAANGVIRITTKKGRQGQTRWRFSVEGGLINDANDYPANFQGVDADGNTCSLVQVAAGSCQQAQVQSFNLLENSSTSPFRQGDRQRVSANVSGGGDALTYFASGLWEREDGALPANDLGRVNLRANLGAQALDNLNLSLSTGYVSSAVSLPQNDNNILGFHLNGLFGGVDPDSWFAFTPEELETIIVDQRIERFIGSGTGDWDPFQWLNVRASGGLDVTNRKDVQFFPVGAIQAFGLDTGARQVDRFQSFTYTADVSSTARAQLTSDIGSQTSVGLQYFEESVEGLSTVGENFPAGSASQATAATTTATEETITSKTFGLFVQEQLSYKDRIFLTGALRGDDNSAFGEDFDIVVYPKVSASWVISEEPFFPEGSVFSTLRLRAAWGESGNQPGVTDAVRFLRGVAATSPEGVDGTGVTFVPDPNDPSTFGGLGNPNLKPERSQELEVGFDLGLAEDRVNLELTLYDKDTQDALVFRNIAPSVGAVSGRFENIGNSQNRGIELGLSTLAIDSRAVKLNLSFTGSVNDNELVELGEGVEPFSFGFEQRHAPGFPLGAYWERPFTFSDANDDGIIAPDEVTVGDTLVFIDDAIPTTEFNFRAAVDLWDRVQVFGLLDYRGGHSLHNNTSEFRCRLGNSQERHDPSTPLGVQAACIADAFGGTEAGYIENAEFLKLREVGATLKAPDSWARLIGADRASLTIAGRNLFTWTHYSGVDPEVNTFGAQGVDNAGFGQSDFGTAPPVRLWTARLNLHF
jgi:TonB-linked SusC/RagA family outer membrane protein